MKIIASIPQKYGDPRFVIEASSEEIAALCLNPSPYPQVTVTGSDGIVAAREIKSLQPGDEISPDASKCIRQTVSAFLGSRSEIEKSMASLRGAMTKLANLSFQ